jgi:cation transport ATPase
MADGQQRRASGERRGPCRRHRRRRHDLRLLRGADRTAIEALPGVSDASVNLATGRARVRGDAETRRLGAIVSAVEGRRLPAARSRSMTLAVEGMTWRLLRRTGREGAERRSRGARRLGQPRRGAATVRVLPGAVTVADLVGAAGRVGYEARVATGAARSAPSARRRRSARRTDLKRQVVVAGALTLPIVVLDMGSHLVPAFHHWLLGLMSQQAIYIVLFVLASIVQFGPGWQFYAKGWPALRRLAPDMNSLVMLGTSAAWGYSVVATFAAGRASGGCGQRLFRGGGRDRHADPARALARGAGARADLGGDHRAAEAAGARPRGCCATGPSATCRSRRSSQATPSGSGPARRSRSTAPCSTARASSTRR